MARYASNLGSDSNPGTQAQPVLTIGKAIALVREDQKTDRRLGVVNVEPGDYSEAIALSDDITIQRSDGKPAQTVDVENGMYTGGPAKQVRLVRATVGGPLITVGSAQRVTLRGLVIDGKNLGGRGLDADGAKDLSIDSCQFINHVTNVVYKGREKGSLDDPYLGDRSVTDSSSGAGIRVLRARGFVSVKASVFLGNRCDRKFSIPSPFNDDDFNKSYEISNGVSLSGSCLRRIIRTFAEVYHNGGGAVFAENSADIRIEQCLFVSNAAGRGGGVRFGNKTYGSFVNNHFIQNVAWVDGGAIAVWDFEREANPRRQPVTIKGCRFSSNSSGDDGGAVYLTAKTIATVSESTFDANVASGNGGGLRASFGSEVAVNDCTFKNNVANSDALTKDSSNKDGGGAAAVQNSNASFSRCVFSGNKVIGFAGGALYCNTVKYEEFLEKLGDAAFDDNFDNILKNKYLFRNAVIRISGCTFSGNEASGKTCYGSEASQSAKGGIAVMARFAGCDEVLEQLGKLRDSQKCDLAKGTGIRGGGAGGAIYVLQQRDGYLPLSVTIEGSSFTNDISLHDDPRLRAEIVIQNCRDVMLSGLDITATLPTAYKLVLENVVVRDATGVGVACSHGKLLSVDPRVRVAESTCK